MRILALTVVALALGAVGARAAFAADIYFETPSHNIVCGYFSAAGYPGSLDCVVASGLTPLPPRPSVKNCHGLDFASDEVDLAATGHLTGTCRGDVGVLFDQGRAPVLAYGKVWKHGPFTCSSATTGLTCTNTSKHGFFLSRQSWHAL
jgi:hypothetical protein